ncbi:uncharacterized protein LOC131876338 [Cryptomeria japonica]|uniref:uncharacterized protein LOC131876338 n=1 Tax=Cryptomeria japonica TaxID=3369 RepID=UPI0027D9FB5A|nr:uncharacterized protein LOC131876338 [Cryptomeria japonica]
MDSCTEKHEPMYPKDLSFTHIDGESNFSDPTCPDPTETLSYIELSQLDSSTEKHDSMNSKNLSFTQFDGKPTFSDPTCPDPTETASYIEQSQLDSSTEKHASMNFKYLSFTQIDGKPTFSDLTCPDPTDTASCIEESQLDSSASYIEQSQLDSSSEKHASMNSKDLSFTQIDGKPTFSDPTCPDPTETASFIQQSQLNHSECHQLCLPRMGKIVTSVTLFFVSNTCKVDDVTFPTPKSSDETSGDRTPLPPIFCQKEISPMPKNRDETSADRIPLPPIVWQKEASLRLVGVFGSVCAALFAAYWGWSCLYDCKQR